MIKKLIIAGIFMLAFFAPAFAHSAAESTFPEAGTSLQEMPKKLSIVFVKPVRVTKVLLVYRVESKEQKIKIKLTSKEYSKELNLVPEFLGLGDYEVQWRALGEDGHVLKGQFEFTIGAN